MKMTKKKRTKNILISLITVFVLALIGAIFFFGVQESQFDFNNQCSLDACPSGYTDEGEVCRDLQCTRVCLKNIMGCGSYGSAQDISGREINVGLDAPNNKWKVYSTGSFTENTNKCYKYQTIARLIVSDRSPAVLQRNSDSHKVFTWNNLGKVQDTNICSTSNTIIAETPLSEGKKGTGLSSGVAFGEFRTYSDTNCNTPNTGSEGSFQVSLTYSTAPWTTIDYEETTTSCLYECDTNNQCGTKGAVSQKRCEGNRVVQDFEVPRCSSNSCDYDSVTETIETCISNQECLNARCVTKIVASTEDEIILEDLGDGTKTTPELDLTPIFEPGTVLDPTPTPTDAEIATKAKEVAKKIEEEKASKVIPITIIIGIVILIIILLIILFFVMRRNR